MSSGVTKGKAKFVEYSLDVIIEGENVGRLNDLMILNGNNGNTLGKESQGNMSPEEIDDLFCQIFCMCNANADMKADDIIDVNHINPSSMA